MNLDKCDKCGQTINLLDHIASVGNYFCDKCYYTCPICDKYEPEVPRYIIINQHELGKKRRTYVCWYCGNQWEVNIFEQQLKIVLSEGVLIKRKEINI